jgi:hypothetical protein
MQEVCYRVRNVVGGLKLESESRLADLCFSDPNYLGRTQPRCTMVRKGRWGEKRAVLLNSSSL